MQMKNTKIYQNILLKKILINFKDIFLTYIHSLGKQKLVRNSRILFKDFVKLTFASDEKYFYFLMNLEDKI